MLRLNWPNENWRNSSMSEQRDHLGYPTTPRKIDGLTWFYEQKRGLYVLNEPIEGARCTTIIIPWRKLCAAVDRHRAVKRRKSK